MKTKLKKKDGRIGARVGSERWHTERLKKGESYVLMNRPSNSVSGMLSQAGLAGKYFVENATVVMSRNRILRATVITRK